MSPIAMIKNNYYRSDFSNIYFCLAALCFLFCSSIEAQTLLADDFNDNSLDAAKWQVVQYNGFSFLTENNQRIELQGRAQLQSNAVFGSGTTVKARIQMTGGQDNFAIGLRCSANSSGPFGTPDRGIFFFIWASSGANTGVSIGFSGNIQGSAQTSNYGPAPNDLLEVHIVDNGFSILADLHNLTSGYHLSLASAITAGANQTGHITFFNRESPWISTAYLDDVAICNIQPVAIGHFFVGRTIGTSSARCPVDEFDSTGAYVRTHILDNQLPIDIARVRPTEVTPWGTLLCSTDYFTNALWFELDGNGEITMRYQAPGGCCAPGMGPQGVTASGNGQVIGAWYHGYGASELRSFSAQTGSEQWRIPSSEALAPSVVNSTIHVGRFMPQPVAMYSLAGSSLGTFGAYRHVFITKALANQRLLIGSNPTDSGPTVWVIRDLTTSSDSTLNTSSLSIPDFWADVDDNDGIWILAGNQAHRYGPGMTNLERSLILYGLASNPHGFAVSGAPGVASVSATLPGCGSSTALAPALAVHQGAAPRLASSLLLRATTTSNSATGALLHLGLSDTSAYGVPLPYNLASYGMPGCNLYTLGIAAAGAPIVAGSADWSIPIPSDQSLIGFNLFLQAMLFDPIANAAGIALSNGARAILGL